MSNTIYVNKLIKNEISQGMLLTTSEKKKVKLIEVNEEIKLGTIVK